MRWLLALIVLTWAGLAEAKPLPRPIPICRCPKMATLEATQTGGWILNRASDEGWSYGVFDADPEGYRVEGSYSAIPTNYRALFQFDTTLPAGATIVSATLTRTRHGAFGSMPLYYNAGTWAATPPAADDATYIGGDNAATEASNSDLVKAITLNNNFINTSGITSILIYTEDGYDDWISSATLSIDYLTASTPHANLGQIMFCS